MSEYTQFRQSLDTEAWYTVDVSRIKSADLLTYDEETDAYIENAYTLWRRFTLQLYYLAANAVLRLFMTRTSANAWLGRELPFLFSFAHLRLFLHRIQSLRAVGDSFEKERDSVPVFERVLDIGAGDGKLTEMFRPFAREIYVTEFSPPMQLRLRARGFRLLGIEDWDAQDTPSYDLIVCLNVIDRHSRPRTLLRRLREKLLRSSVHGVSYLLFAAVLPVQQYIEYTSGHRPEESIEDMSGLQERPFEAHLERFVDEVLTPAGLRVRAFSRLPYMWEGDMFKSFYNLDNVLFLLEPVA